ncbi:MAG: MFS transporter [Chloroflexi bacterium]|nr:MFS transporter [Chloroflexota bacterium]
MRADAAAVERGARLFFGWWIVAAAAASTALSGGLYYYGGTTFMVPLAEEFGWSRTALAGVFSVASLQGGILGPFGGYLVDRFGPRRVMLFGVALMGAGYMAFSRIDSLPGFYFTFIAMIALGAGLGTQIPPMVSAANWFVRRRGQAMGLVLSGVGVGGLLVPVLSWIISAHGWRTAAVGAGLLVWAVGFPLAFVMRRRPEYYGLLPDGDAAPPAGLPGAVTPEATAAAALERDYTLKEALRTPAFWLLTAAFGVRQVVISGVVITVIPALVAVNIPRETAALALGAVGISSIAGRIGFGWLGDRLPKRYVMAVTLALLAVGALLFAGVTEPWHVLPFLAVYPPRRGADVRAAGRLLRTAQLRHDFRLHGYGADVRAGVGAGVRGVGVRHDRQLPVGLPEFRGCGAVGDGNHAGGAPAAAAGCLSRPPAAAPCPAQCSIGDRNGRAMRRFSGWGRRPRGPADPGDSAGPGDSGRPAAPR